ncbi:hypothetical protein IAD21_02865 [Abditibacteriota bacterium]|nr:hypothetical protein IAD21_02865 [Abditibacteriota bacterium]
MSETPIMMTEEERQFLRALYDDFNGRDIEAVLAKMQPDVEWANGMAGGFVYGRDGVREYWWQQFQVIQPHLETLRFEKDDRGRYVITVHQVVRDMEGNVLMEKTVGQRFAMKDGLIQRFDILEVPSQEAV